MHPAAVNPSDPRLNLALLNAQYRISKPDATEFLKGFGSKDNQAVLLSLWLRESAKR